MSHLLNNIITSKIFDRVMSLITDPYVTIFTLHRPTPANNAYNGTDEALLDQCLAYAHKQGFQILSIDQIVQDALDSKKYSRPTLAFTLDDGFEDQATRLIPVLLKYKTAPTLFVVTNFIDHIDWTWDAKLSYITWNSPLLNCQFSINQQVYSHDLSNAEARKKARRLVISKAKTLAPAKLNDFIGEFAKHCEFELPKTAPDEYRPASWEQLQALEMQGLKIGSHTQSHLVFNSASTDRIVDELTQSKNRLVNMLKAPSEVFCYPLGTSEDISIAHGELVNATHYRGAITTSSSTTDLATIRKHPYQITRIGFPSNFETFVRYASWAEAARSKLPI